MLFFDDFQENVLHKILRFIVVILQHFDKIAQQLFAISLVKNSQCRMGMMDNDFNHQFLIAAFSILIVATQFSIPQLFPLQF
jgi:hypothetical protein